MALATLVGPQGAEALLRACPIEPAVYRRGGSELDERITLPLVGAYIDHGLTDPAFTAAVKDGKAAHPGRFSRDGKLRPGKLRELFEGGHTVNLRHLQTRVPYLAELCREIEAETGCTMFVSGLLTPPGAQGLTHHWDQFLAVVTHLHGRKRWPLWRPEVQFPVDEYLASPTVWTAEMQERWNSTEPYAVFDLEPGDTLVMPRGWVHSPHCFPDDPDPSLHLTFALRERMSLDLAEALVRTALDRPEFRAGIAPSRLTPENLADTLADTRAQIVRYLATTSPADVADTVRAALFPKPAG
ncbi:JmjC domain-containing protein [Kitasatospora sp. NPDC059795]|uniref:JmjC domain-containing protein n=1 Tax=Kitasatospora sp. NPDC059795 TaxID=3346949 RepID=UPI003662CD08